MIVDASVAIEWFLTEEGSDEARRILAHETIHAPGAIRIEVAHDLWKSVRRRVLEPEALSPAIDLMNRLQHPVYDCLYLALAEREGLSLVTADQRQFAAARKARIEARLL